MSQSSAPLVKDSGGPFAPGNRLIGTGTTAHPAIGGRLPPPPPVAPGLGGMLAMAGRPPAAAQTGYNRLTGTPIAAMPMTIQPPPAAAAVQQPAAPASIAGVPQLGARPAAAGQDMSNTVAGVQQLGQMSDADLATEQNRLSWLHQNIGAALQDGANPSHSDVARLIGRGIDEGAIPAGDAGQMMAGLTTNPADLRAELQQRQLLAMHGLVHLAGEQAARSDAQPPAAQGAAA